MKTTKLRFVASLPVLLSASLVGEARAEPAGVSVETDPATFVFDGYSAHARVSPGPWPRWTVGLGTYAMDMPDAVVDINPDNRDEGWNARLSFGAGLFVDYHLAGPRDGAFVGVQLAVQRYRVTRDDMPGSATYTAGLVMARLGYRWFPTRSGLYLMPWLGVGGTAPVGGDRTVAGETYDVFPVAAFATLHAGWMF